MKIIKLILALGIVSIFCIGNSFAQELPPKSGSYYCYTTNYVVGAGGINPKTGGDVFGNNPLQLVPAFFGNIVLDGQGNYKFTGRTGGGKYIFNKATSKLSFTGDLKNMTVQEYTSKNYSFVLIQEGLSFLCGIPGEKGSTTDKTKPSVSNEGLSGKILTTVSDKNNGFIAKVFEFDLAKGSYSIIFPDGVAAQNTKGEILYIDKESRIKITDRTGNTTIKQLTDKISYNSDEIYPAISDSGDYLALTVANRSNTGTLSDIISNGVKILITDRSLGKITEFSGFKQAGWMPNGGLVVVGDGNKNKGLFVIDAKFKSVKKIAEGYESAQMPAVSPDGKTVAFAYNNDIWTINLDGTNPKKVIYGGNETYFPAWSSDGNFIAANVRVNLGGVARSILFIVNLKADKGFYVKDGNGDYVESRNKITWLPDKLNNSADVTDKIKQTRNIESKVSTDSITAYTQTKQNKDPNITKANEMYRQIMGDDLDNYDDVAAAFTYIIVFNYAALHQLDGVPTNQVRRVYQQFVDKLSKTEGFESATNEVKQQLAELAILDGVETFRAIKSKDQNKINETTMRLMKKYIGNEAATLKITESGMEF